MKTLIIMRHAKSSWSDPGLDDLHRPLNARGRRSAKAIGEWLSFGGFRPQQVLSSNSRRTAQTWEYTGLKADVTYLPELYHASASTILGVAHGASADCVMILGHNPGLAEFSARLVNKPPAHEKFDYFPTGATLVTEFEGAWDELTLGAATLRAFTVPRDLIA